MNSKQFSGIYQAVLLSCSALFCVTALAQTSNTAEFQAPRANQNVVATASTAQDSALREVIVQGYGKDVPDAAQNAAQNALQQVVGLFIDSKTILEKRTEIQDGVRRETKNISTDIKEYSQGSIKTLEIVEVKTEGIVQVTARVVVRVEDFRVLVKQIAEHQREVSPGIAAAIQSNLSQTENLAQIIASNIHSPNSKGEYLQIRIDKVIGDDVFEEARKSSLHFDMGNIDSFFKFHKDRTIIALKLTASLSNDYLSELDRVLSNISKDKRTFSVAQRGIGQDTSWISQIRNLAFQQSRTSSTPTDSRNDLIVSIVRTNNDQNLIWLDGWKSFALPKNHRISDLARFDHQVSRGISVNGESYSISSQNLHSKISEAIRSDQPQKENSKLTIEFYGSENNVIHTEELDPAITSRSDSRIASPEISKAHAFRRNFTPWRLFATFERPLQYVIIPNRTFYVFVVVDDQMLTQVKSVKASIKF